jgi:hypothetical protein
MSDWKRAWEGDWSQINEEQQATTRPQEQKTHPGHTKARERDEWPDALEGSGRDTAKAGEDLRPITRIATRGDEYWKPNSADGKTRVSDAT